MQDGALDHALEAERGLGVDFPVGRDARRLLGDVLGEVLAQLIHVRAAGAQYSAAVGLSSNASSRCSTVMNSWRFCRASTNAM